MFYIEISVSNARIFPNSHFIHNIFQSKYPQDRSRDRLRDQDQLRDAIITKHGNFDNMSCTRKHFRCS